MCEAGFPQEKIKYASTTIDLTVTVELTIEVPSIDFDPSMIFHQLKRDASRYMKGVKIEKDAVARALGMESSKFLSMSKFQNIDVDKMEMTQYNKDGKVEARHERKG